MMKSYKKESKTYPNGAVLNFMRDKLCVNRSKEGHMAYYWKRGDLLWLEHDYKDDVVNLYYWKKDGDNRTDEEINEILKKHVRFFRSFYKSAKDIVLRDKKELDERLLKLNEMYKKEGVTLAFKKELDWLIIFYQVYWLEYDDKDALNQMGGLFHMRSCLTKDGKFEGI
jgi:hypothetical protein